MNYYAACCQTDQPNPRDREQMTDNTSRLIAQLEQAVLGYRPFHDVKLVVFPEFAHAAPIYQSAEELADRAASVGLAATTAETVRKALEEIVQDQPGPGRILITGSLYLAGKVLAENA